MPRLSFFMRKIFTAGILLSVLLSACLPQSGGEVEATSVDEIVIQKSEQVMASPIAALQDEVDTPVPSPPVEENIAPTATYPATPRPGLEATDPSTVSLASGQVQLVEFFAYW